MPTPTSIPAPTVRAPAPVAPVQPTPETARDRARHAPAAHDDIAVIGLSGRYPGSDTLDELWQNLLDGRNCIGPVPPGRWRQAAPGTFGGFLRQVDRFDHQLFGIPPDEARLMSPESRLFLEVAWEAFEDAGYSRARLQRLQDGAAAGIGVFVASMYQQYAWTAATADEGAARSNETEWQIANRVSHSFDLRGPSLAINAACAGSMTAIHLACESLQQGSCSMALAGGVNLSLHPSKFERLLEVGFRDPGARSRSFGQGQGYVPGEGVGAVLLKPLARALADGDRIDAVIRSSVASHGGGRQKFTVPDPLRQAELMNRSLQRAGVAADRIAYVESAANGSPLGDAIEVTALRKVFDRAPGAGPACALGTVKSNLGHLEAASGISQLTKVLLQLRHRTLVPTLHADPLNPAIRLDGSPFRLQQDTRPWAREADPASGEEQPLLAMINSFGAGGSYVNLIVEEHRPQGALQSAAMGRQAGGRVACLVSARSASSLRRRLLALRQYIAAQADLQPVQLAASLRKLNLDLPRRAAFLAATRSELLEALEAAVANCAGEGPVLGVPAGAGDLEPALAEPLEAWLAGRAAHPDGIAWPAGGPSLSLPAYCFDHDEVFTLDPASAVPGGSDATSAQAAAKALFERVARGELTKEAAWKLLQTAEA